MKLSSVAAVIVVLGLAGAAENATAQQRPSRAEAQTTMTAPVAGVAPVAVGIRVEEVAMVARGWSAKKHILGKELRNDQQEKIGEVEDIIIGPDKSVTYAIVGVGGFLGMGERHVAIPVTQLRMQEGRFVLPGATKEAVKGMPEFHYAK